MTGRPQSLPSGSLPGFLAAFWLAAAPHPAAAADRPNILLLLTDDQGWGDVRSHGNRQIDTPVLDRLAADGARFDRFFVSPVCAPTRASLLTGRYHLRTGVHGVTRGWETMRSQETTLAEMLGAAGYATACFGKWHNGAHYPQNPAGQGFQEFLGFCGGHWNNYFDTTLEHNGRPVPIKGYIADVLTDAALDFIDRRRAEPFFCYLAYNTPHAPFQVPDRYFDKYKRAGLDDTLASVYGMVENLDDNIGRLLRRLDDSGLATRTIVVFLTDNGPNSNRYNGDMKGRKGSVQEGGVRVPLFIRYPAAIRPGTVVKPIAAHIDLLPTLLELAGVAPAAAARLDGRSLVPLLTGQGSADWPSRRLFTHQAKGGSVEPFPGAVRTDRWRLVNGGSRWELYDLVEDPGQMRDLAAGRTDVVKELSAAYLEWFRDVTRDGFAPLPTEVGHAEAPFVELPAHEARLKGGLRWQGRAGWANDWITGWSRLEDQVSWPLDVVRPGRYQIQLLYTCPAADVGARLRIAVGGQTLECKVARPHDPAPLPSPDRVPRGEVYEKVWAGLEAGVVQLDPGRTELVLQALSRPGQEVLELKAVRIGKTD